METTNTFDKFNNELFLDDVLIYTDVANNISEGIGYIKKDNEGKFYVLNVDMVSVSDFAGLTNLERRGNSK